MPQEKGLTTNLSGGFVEIILLVIVVAILVVGVVIYKQKSSKTPGTAQVNKSEQVEKVQSQWNEGGVAITGNFADAEIVDAGDGKFRMYYAITRINNLCICKV